MMFQIIPAHFLTPNYEVTCDQYRAFNPTT